MKALITKKIGMTSTIASDGKVEAVTLLSASPSTITQLKSVERDGYHAVQVGFMEDKKISKPQAGHAKASGKAPKIVREFRVDEPDPSLEVGTELTAETFLVGDVVQVTGTSKGKGWTGTIKRHNFNRQRKTHGGKGNTRQPGSIGSMYPQKIFKGKRMAGQSGHATVTVRNLRIAIVDLENNIIGVTGAVPGPNKGIVTIRGAK